MGKENRIFIKKRGTVKQNVNMIAIGQERIQRTGKRRI